MEADYANSLGSRLSRELMLGALDRLRVLGIDGREHVDALVEELRAAAPAALAEALGDARAAIEAGLSGYGGPTAVATMRLAGARAADAVIARRARSSEARS
jgi:hypothetical protein